MRSTASDLSRVEPARESTRALLNQARGGSRDTGGAVHKALVRNVSWYLRHSEGRWCIRSARSQLSEGPSGQHPRRCESFNFSYATSTHFCTTQMFYANDQPGGGMAIDRTRVHNQSRPQLGAQEPCICAVYIRFDGPPERSGNRASQCVNIRTLGARSIYTS